MADVDRFGLDEDTNPNYISKLLALFVPQFVARRAVGVSVSTDRDRYAPGEDVEITVELRNRIPLPITVPTRTRRIWGWAVDGEVGASDEATYLDTTRGSIRFRGWERKRFTRTWDGRFKRVGANRDPTRWEDASPGTHEVEAFVALPGRRVSDSTTIAIE